MSWHSSKYGNIIQVYVKYRNRQLLVWLFLISTHSIWEYDVWFTQTSSGMQLGHKTRPGHCNMQHWRFSSDWSYMCVSWSLVFLTALYFGVTYCSTFRAHTSFTHVFYVCKFPWEGPGNIRHLREWGTSTERGAISCHVEYVTPSFLTFFQFGRTLSKLRDGFALRRMCYKNVFTYGLQKVAKYWAKWRHFTRPVR